MNHNEINGKVAAVVVAVIAAIGIIVAVPDDNKVCKPHSIESYTRAVISYKDCLALDKCDVTVHDISRYRFNQEQLDRCVELAVQHEND